MARQKIQQEEHVTSDGRSGKSVSLAQQHSTLRQTVKEALLTILNDSGAPAAAKASACRTLLDHFDGQENERGEGRRGAELTIDELDAEISKLEK